MYSIAGGANSAGQTREMYDPTYCSVKLPGPQPLAPMDAETAERHVDILNYSVLSSPSVLLMDFPTTVVHYFRKPFQLLSSHTLSLYI
jgi:hypothetical protein